MSLHRGRSLAVVLNSDLAFNFEPRSKVKYSPIFSENIGPQLSFGGLPTVANLHNNNAYQQQSDYRERVTTQFVQELADDIPVVLEVVCGAIGITIYLNSRRFFGSFFGMSLLAVGILFPWRMLLLLVL